MSVDAQLDRAGGGPGRLRRGDAHGARPDDDGTGLSAPPISITILTIGVTAIGGIVLLLICNANRGLLTPLEGVPWVIPFVLIIVLVCGSCCWRAPRLGRYIYAIGANPEAARRAGINVTRVRTIGFVMCRASPRASPAWSTSRRQGSMSTDIDGGNSCCTRVAAAVIGGTSLFGGRGKMLHALLGGDRHRGGVQRPGADGHQRRRSGHRDRDRADRRGHARLAGQAPGHRSLTQHQGRRAAPPSVDGGARTG